jgi:hypothetical protein
MGLLLLGRSMLPMGFWDDHGHAFDCRCSGGIFSSFYCFIYIICIVLVAYYLICFLSISSCEIFLDENALSDFLLLLSICRNYYWCSLLLLLLLLPSFSQQQEYLQKHGRDHGINGTHFFGPKFEFTDNSVDCAKAEPPVKIEPVLSTVRTLVHANNDSHISSYV